MTKIFILSYTDPDDGYREDSYYRSLERAMKEVYDADWKEHTEASGLWYSDEYPDWIIIEDAFND